MSVTWMIFEILGTIAFAFSGAIVGLYRRMDIFGITVLAVMTGVGGGMIRDVLCGIIPPSALTHPMSLLVSIGTALAVSFLYPFFRIPKRGKVIISFFYHISDTIGLSAFTVTGVLTAFYAWPSHEYVLPTMLGLITAVGGGIIRDMMARRMPVVLYMDVYAIASVAGGLLMSSHVHPSWLPAPLPGVMDCLYGGAPSPGGRHPLWLAALPSAPAAGREIGKIAWNIFYSKGSLS